MKTTRRTQEQRRQEAQEKVLQAAIQVFTEKGFQEASLEEIAELSGLTIRPIYHYFGSKKGLFLAVTELFEQQLTDSFSQIVVDQPQAIMAGWRMFVEHAQSSAFRQVLLIDAPNILGRERWYDSSVVQLTQKALRPFLPDSPAHAQLISRMLLAAMAEAALLIADDADGDSLQAANDLVSVLLTQFETLAKPA